MANRKRLINMKKRLTASVMLALAACALSPMDAGAIGRKESGARIALFPGLPALQTNTGCDFRPRVGGGMEAIFCRPTGVLPQAGVEVGDMILAINRTPVNDIAGLVNAANKARATALPDECIIIDHRTGNFVVLNIAF
jgi:hypothetical protein